MGEMASKWDPMGVNDVPHSSSVRCRKEAMKLP